MAFELFDLGVEIKRQNLRREYPSESDSEIEARVDAWILERPGAELGDADGVVSHRDFGQR